MSQRIDPQNDRGRRIDAGRLPSNRTPESLASTPRARFAVKEGAIERRSPVSENQRKRGNVGFRHHLLNAQLKIFPIHAANLQHLLSGGFGTSDSLVRAVPDALSANPNGIAHLTQQDLCNYIYQNNRYDKT
jgi:hypothetical protein